MKGTDCSVPCGASEFKFLYQVTFAVALASMFEPKAILIGCSKFSGRWGGSSPVAGSTTQPRTLRPSGSTSTPSPSVPKAPTLV